ncbi:MAG: tetratricopeptide repeat protein [Edaphocola sp.]
MNKFLLTSVAAALALNAGAQSVQEGEKMISYGRYVSAEKLLEPLAAKDAYANYELGLAEVEQEEFGKARATFAKYPDDFYNQAGTARLLLDQGKKDEANALLTKVVDKAKKKEWEKYKAAADAITYAKEGNIIDAITWYKKAIEINPADANIYIALGDAHLKTAGGGGEAMTAYETAIEKGNNNSLAYSKIGDLWYRAQRYEDALKNYQSAKDADPVNPLPYKSLAYAYQRAGKFDNALKNMEEYMKLSDNSDDDNLNHANLLFLSGKYPEAQAKIQQLQAKGITKPYLYRLVAYSAYETKDYPKALGNMQTFWAKQDPDKIIPSDYVYSGKIYAALAQADSTKEKVYSDSADYYYNIAVSKDTTKDKRALYMQIADAYKAAKNYGKAGDWYGRIVADNPDASELDYFNWGLYNYYGKDYAEAAKAFSALKEKYPNDNVKGKATYWQGRTAAATDPEAKTGAGVEFYKEWLALPQEHKDADLLNAYNYLAYYYYNTDKQADALTYVNKILEKDPSNGFATQVKDYYAKKAKGGK